MLFARYNDFTYSSSGIPSEAVDALMGAFVVGIIAGLLYVVFRILIALAVYNDAMVKANSNSVMWAVLVGIFGLIPEIIYLCTRNSNFNRLIICSKCGFTHRISEFNCPQCGVENPFSQQFATPLTEIQRRKAKQLLIASIIVWVVSIILSIIAIVWIVSAAIKTGDYSYTY